MEVPKLPHVILLLRREEESAAVLGQTVDGGPEAEEEFLLRGGDLGLRRPPARPAPQTADLLVEERSRAFPDEEVPLLYSERSLVESVGRIERLYYEAEVRTQDYFATAFLHRVIKGLLIDAVPELEAVGIQDLLLGGMDLENRFTGLRALPATVGAMKEAAVAKLEALRDAGVIVDSFDEEKNQPLYAYRNLAITIRGDVARVRVTVSPVTGISYIEITQQLTLPILRA